MYVIHFFISKVEILYVLTIKELHDKTYKNPNLRLSDITHPSINMPLVSQNAQFLCLATVLS